MRFDDDENYTYDLKLGTSPSLNFDTFWYSLRTNTIFFLNEDFNTLIVN